MHDEASALRAEAERCRRRAEFWRGAAAMLHVATWQHDLVAEVGDWSDEARALFGITEENAREDAFLRAVHPDDRGALTELVRDVRARGGELTHRHRVVRPDGDVRWVETRLRIEHEPDGRPTYLVGAAIDRTASERSEQLPRSKAEEELRTSEQTLRELGANLPGLLWVREVDSERLLYANDAWTAVLGRRPVVGEDYWQLVKPVHPEDLPRLVVAPLRGTDQERDEVVRFVLPSGDIAWYRVCKFGIRDANGKPYRVAGFCMEVTQQRAIEEKIRASLREKEILLREVHHRVKNNLQVISSLLRLQAATARAPGLAELLAQSQSRVASMALVHQLLHRSSDLSRISFGAYAEALATSLASTYGIAPDRIAVVVDAGDLTFTIDSAVPCGLLLNEIVSNSLKHAYPDGGRGTIRITLRRDDDVAYRLSVSDDGAGLPADFEERQQTSLGSKLIKSLVAQIGGTVTWTSSPRGTAYEIVFRGDLDESPREPSPGSS